MLPAVTRRLAEGRPRPGLGAACVLGLLMLSLLSLLSGCSGPVPGRAGTPPAASSAAVPASAPAVRAIDVLRSWDRARARAFAAGDVAALRRLYVPGSAAGTTDAGTLRAYLRRGLRVEGMRMQVLALDVLVGEPDRLRLVVTDRLADGAVATGPGGAVPLPADRASTRTVELVRDGPHGAWQVASVTESAPRPAGR